MNRGAAIARLLFDSGAIAVSGERAFVLAAGWASPVYVDCRRLIGRPDWARATTDFSVVLVEDGMTPIYFTRQRSVSGAV